jgi:predicted dehydrogenase
MANAESRTALRLALSGGDQCTRQVIAGRLRRATLLENPDDCDAVVFLTFDSVHVTAIERLLNTHVHVLLAAQPWLSRGDVDRLSAAAGQRSAECLFLVNPDRYLPSRQLVRQHIESGKLGDVGLVRSHRWAPIAAGSSPRTPMFPPRLVRDLDVVNWLLGKMPNVVYSAKSSGFIQVHLGFPDGAMALIDNHDQLPPGDGYHSLTVIGSSGAAYADDHHDRQLHFGGGPPQAVPTGEGEAHLAVMVQEFVDTFCEGRVVPGSVDAWRDVLTLADAVKESLSSRKAVHLEGR